MSSSSAHDPLRAYLRMNSEGFYRAFDISNALFCRSKGHDASLTLFVCAAAKDPRRLKNEPPRITSNVKLNLQFLRRIKEKGTGARPATGYRRKKIERDPSKDLDELDKRNFYDSSTFIEIELRRPVLLVDGYNMCGYWSKLKKHFKKGDLDYARQILIEELIGFSVLKGTKVVVVFDAAASGLPDHKETYQGIDVVFSATTSADTWIEREVELLRKDGCPKVWVVTSDHIQQQCANASIKDAQKERDQILNEMTSYSTKGKLLEDNLDPEVCTALKALKKQLLEAEHG